MRKRTMVLSLLTGIPLVAFLAIFGRMYLIISQPAGAPSIASDISPNSLDISPNSMGVVDKVVSRLEWGNIAFDTPKKMRLEESKIIELLLAPTKSAHELQSSLMHHEQTESAQYKYQIEWRLTFRV